MLKKEGEFLKSLMWRKPEQNYSKTILLIYYKINGIEQIVMIL